MTPELTILRDELARITIRNCSQLRGYISDLVQNRSDRNLLILCANSGILLDFLQHKERDFYFITQIKNKLVEEFFFNDQAAEKAISYCKFLTEKEQETELIPYRKGDKWGFCDRSKRIIINCEFDSVKPFNEGVAAIGLRFAHFKNLLWGFIDSNGTMITSVKYKYIGKFKNGLAIVKDLKFGFVNIFGEEVIPLKYDFVRHYNKDLNLVGLVEEFDDSWGNKLVFWKYGLIDKFGNVIIDINYSEFGFLYNDMAIVRLQDYKIDYTFNSWIGIDKKGNKISDIKYAMVSSLKEGLVKVGLEMSRKEGNKMVYLGIYRWGFIDTSMNEIIPCKFANAFDFHEGLAKVSKRVKVHNSFSTREKWGFINNKGKIIIPIQFEGADNFREGLAKVNIKGEIW